ncbi:hypothetical protein AUR04nite_28990 [Glutamicibacter uratoxydans]|uniref:Aminoglycoside phosphotransferase domain-containing protein n=1 Tax=Glutamicibacter uratoxydans TaxID=43667 RepID=A0A4Y4DRW6_GLUUR|nr:hypothetical protein [Glutamicibacter uratoxydans]GED07367.1 hypothetical protein AUR04nite_28990 [Glutamicibacter uratoxydans]
MAQWIDVWNSDDWREAAAEWIDQACSAYGISRVGGPDFWPADLHQISAIVHTDAADLIFSAAAPGLASEAAATVKAGELIPDKVVMPLAIDRMAGYMLSPDFGHTLADLGDTVETWELALASLGSFQVALMGHEEDFFDSGVTVVDPQFLPEQFEQALMLHVSLDPSHPLYLDPSRADSLVAHIDRLNTAAQALHAGPVPLSLEHGAFDLAQVVVPAETGVHGRILNLGSAHWAHPFSSLAVPLAAMCEAWDCSMDDERVMRVLAAYLGEFAAYGTPDELYSLIDPAVFVASLSQHETWLRLLLDADDEQLAAHSQLVLDTLALG